MSRLLQIQYKLLQIKLGSKSIYLLLLPPIYGVWLWSICRIVSCNKTLRHYLSVATFMLAIALTIAFFIYPILLCGHNSFLETNLSDLLIFAGINYWILISVLIAYQSIKYENEILKSIIKTTFADYFIRYFIIMNWWIGIWGYQKIVNQYKVNYK